MTQDTAIQTLLAKEEIREIIGVRYSRGMDWYDLAMLKSCFHHDATLDYGYFKGNAHQWCEMRVVAGNPAEDHRFHYCFPAHIEIDGDTARAESTSFAGLRTDADNQANAEGVETYTYFGARYIDTLARRDAHWRIANRIVQVDFLQRLPGSGGPGGLYKGLPLLTDPSPSHPLFRRLCAAD